MIAAVIDPSETKCVISNTIKKTTVIIRAGYGKRARTTPKDVAIPFPPLKPANKGNT